MATGDERAIRNAAQLAEVGFAEFTTDLVLKIFDGLTAATLNQLEAYTEFIKVLSQDLTEYINETKDDIGGDEILTFIAENLPVNADGSKPVIEEKVTLTAEQATALDDATKVDGDENAADPTPTTTLNSEGVEKILNAIARRLAANKYDSLQNLAQMGLMRLVVTQGTVRTTLQFKTAGSSIDSSQSSSYDNKRITAWGRFSTGKKLAKWFNLSAGGNYSRLRVNTTSSFSQDVSTSEVNIGGFVEINFRSDFLPLNSEATQ